MAARASASSTQAETLTLNDDRAERPSSDLPPLSSVPEAFFDPSFDLANPSTWASLVGQTEAPEAGPSNSAETETQDGLSSHLDTLERYLIHEISLRSSAFFSALSNLQDLHSESASCLTRITELQTSLNDVGSKQAQKGLEIIDAQQRLRVLRVTERNVKTVAELEELLRVARGLVEAGDWAGGLTCLSDVVRWWETYGLDTIKNGESLKHLPLSTLPALSALPETISELTSAVATQLDAALSSLLLSVLARSDDGQPFDGESFSNSIRPMLSGIKRCGRTNSIEETWREVLTTSIREGSRKVCIIFSS